MRLNTKPRSRTRSTAWTSRHVGAGGEGGGDQRPRRTLAAATAMGSKGVMGSISPRRQQRPADVDQWRDHAAVAAAAAAAAAAAEAAKLEPGPDVIRYPDQMPHVPHGIHPPKAAEALARSYSMPPRYQPFYLRKSSGADEQTCIPLRDLPIIRTQGPSKYLDDACVPMSMVHAVLARHVADARHGDEAAPATRRRRRRSGRQERGAGAQGGRSAFVGDSFRANYAPPPQFSRRSPSPARRGCPPPRRPTAAARRRPTCRRRRRSPTRSATCRARRRRSRCPELPPPQYPFG